MVYFEARVKIKFANAKPVTEVYLVNAQSVTEAEAIVAKEMDKGTDFEVLAVKKSRISEVFSD